MNFFVRRHTYEQNEIIAFPFVCLAHVIRANTALSLSQSRKSCIRYAIFCLSYRQIFQETNTFLLLIKHDFMCFNSFTGLTFLS